MTSCIDYANLQKMKMAKINGKMPLSIVQVGDNPASNAYIKGKIKDCNEVGIESFLYKLPEDADQEALNKACGEAAAHKGGVIVQLPIPAHLKVNPNYFYAYQDVDGLFYKNYNPCTPEGIIDWLEFNDVDLKGKMVTIIGRSDLVGKPLAQMMTDRDATVTLCHSKSKELDIFHSVRDSEIIVSAVGLPKHFKWNLPVYGTPKTFIDVGINRDENGKMCGDFDRAHLEKQGHYVTPVPGGVGLLTRVTLLKHVAFPVI